MERFRDNFLSKPNTGMERFRDSGMEWFHSIPPHPKNEHTLRSPFFPKRGLRLSFLFPPLLLRFEVLDLLPYDTKNGTLLILGFG
jgi:hypothetical protein